MPFLMFFTKLFDPKLWVAIGNFFATHWKLIAVVLMVGVIAYQNMSGTRFIFGFETVPALKQDVTELTEANRIYKENNDKFVETLEQRNEEIDAWKKLSDKLEAKMIKLQKDLVILQEETDAEVDDILHDPTPETCEKAIDYLREGVEDLSW